MSASKVEIPTTDHPLVGRLCRVGSSKKRAWVEAVLVIHAGTDWRTGKEIYTAKRARVKWVESGRTQITKVSLIHPLSPLEMLGVQSD